jgi:hypothetical protein
MKFPVDAPKSKVLRALGALGFKIVRERELHPQSSLRLALCPLSSDPIISPITNLQ